MDEERFGNCYLLPVTPQIAKMTSSSSENRKVIEHEIISLLSQLVALVDSLLSIFNKQSNMMLMEFKVEHVKMNHRLNLLETKLNRLKDSMDDINIQNIFLVPLSSVVIDYEEMYNVA